MEFNRAKLTKKSEDWENYDRIQLVKREIKRAERSSWISFCNSIESVNDASRFLKIFIKGPKNSGIYSTDRCIMDRIKLGNTLPAHANTFPRKQYIIKRQCY